MSGEINITKFDAATRQLNAAVRMLFNEADPVATHTLAGAAATLFYDLVEAQSEAEPWETNLARTLGMTLPATLQVVRKSQNFFKHANRDRHSKLKFNPDDTIAVLGFCMMNYSELLVPGEQYSTEVSVFQFWYLGIQKVFPDGPDGEITKAIHEMFPDIAKCDRREQITRGRNVLHDALRRNG